MFERFPELLDNLTSLKLNVALSADLLLRESIEIDKNREKYLYSRALVFLLVQKLNKQKLVPYRTIRRKQKTLDFRPDVKNENKTARNARRRGKRKS